VTVSAQLNKITYNGDGATTQWTFSFPGHDPSAILVYITDSQGNVTLQSTLAYSVTLNPAVQPNPTSIGGFVTLFGSPLAVGNKLTIRRLLPIIQGTSISNQSIVYPPIVETDDDYLTMVDQQLQEQISRSIMVNVSDPNPAPLPPIALRANQQAFWDANGNLTGGQFAGAGVVISAAMQPVVSAATLTAAQIAMGLGQTGYNAISGQKLQIVSQFTVGTAQKGLTIELAGNACYDVFFAAASAGYPPDFQVLLYVNDPRGKRINIPGASPNQFILWPGQMLLVSGNGSAWAFQYPGRWRPLVPITFYVNYNLGNDGAGATAADGLATGAAAFQTIAHALAIVQQFCDGQFSIILESGMTHEVGSGVILDGRRPNAEVTITGAGTVAIPGVRVACSTGGTVFSSIYGGVLTLSNLYLAVDGDASSAFGAIASQGGIINFASCSLGPMPGGVQIDALQNATINISGACGCYGGAANHAVGAFEAFINYNPTSMTFNSGMSFSNFFAVANNSTIAAAQAFSWGNIGFVSGNQANADLNSIINMAGSGIPGTTTLPASRGSWIIP